MKPALLLIDLQEDFLSAPNLQPASGPVVAQAAELLRYARDSHLPVIHILTTVTQSPDNRMPHWQSTNQWRCLLNTPGHFEPEPLRPLPGEHIIHKQFFSAFGNPDLLPLLHSLNIDTLWLAGVHLHGCIRATAMDAYQHHFRVLIADDAVASDDPLHSAITRRYLAKRMADFLPLRHLIAVHRGDSPPSSTPVSHIQTITRAARSAADAWRETSPALRIAPLLRLAELLLENVEPLARLITSAVSKPITQARAEIHRSAALIRACVNHLPPSSEIPTSPSARMRYLPLGVVGIVTPWNNPVAIPIGKIAPALLFGNSVVWKPAPAANPLTQPLLDLAFRAGLQHHNLPLIHPLHGDHSTAAALAEDPLLDAITLSGSLHAGYALQEICARRHIPYQGELGGNNAAIVWHDADLTSAARLIAEAAFGFAGQRCTANRRVILPDSLLPLFLPLLISATASIPLGDPLDPRTVIGPVIHSAKQTEILHLIQRAQSRGLETITPHTNLPQSNLPFLAPTIILAKNPADELVQEESFAPILVIQTASDFPHALHLLNSVRQGLIAALFSHDESLQQLFLRDAYAGVLKLNRATADADALSPLGGWKASGVGPPEHGPSDREFFTRTQTLYTPAP